MCQLPVVFAFNIILDHIIFSREPPTTLRICDRIDEIHGRDAGEEGILDGILEGVCVSLDQGGIFDAFNGRINICDVFA